GAPPSATAPSVAASAAPAAATTPARRGSILWTARPSASTIAARYPRQALRDERGGTVILDCTVRTDMTVGCTVASATPPGLGFGRAALEAARDYRAAAALSDGSNAVGARSRIQISFRLPD